MTEKNNRKDEDNPMKNPSPIGTQHNPVSNPDESRNPVEEALEEREKFKREHDIDEADGEEKSN